LEFGYNYSFVHPPPCELICKMCQYPCRASQISLCCKNNFCESHVLTTTLSDPCPFQKECPICHSEKFEYFPDNQANDAIQSLLVYCPNKDVGCDWVGQINQIDAHVNECLSQEIQCTNNCGKKFQRKYLDEHLVECPWYCHYCKTSADPQEIDKYHKTNCQKFPVLCPNNCGESIPHDSINKHRKNCPLEIVVCEYQDFGCEEKILLKEEEEHYKTKIKEHLDLIRKKVSMKNQSSLHMGRNYCCYISIFMILIMPILIAGPFIRQYYCSYMETGCEEKDLSGLNKANKDLELKISKLEKHIEYLEDIVNEYGTSDEIQDLKSIVTMFTDLIKEINDSCVQEASKVRKETSLLRKQVTVKLQKYSFSNWRLHLSILNLITLHGDQVTPVVLSMTNYSRKRKEKRQWFSSAFYDTKNGNQLCLSVKPDYVTLLVSLVLLTPAQEMSLQNGIFKIEILNQVNDTDHAVDEINLKHVAIPKDNGNQFRQHNIGSLYYRIPPLQDSIKYVWEDTVYFRVAFFGST